MLAISGDAARAFSFEDLDRADLAGVDLSEGGILMGLHAKLLTGRKSGVWLKEAVYGAYLLSCIREGEMKSVMTEGRTWWLWRMCFEVGVAV